LEQFKAISTDKLLPGLDFFAKGHGANNNPVRGYVLATFISLICLLIGNLNMVTHLYFERIKLRLAQNKYLPEN